MVWTMLRANRLPGFASVNEASVITLLGSDKTLPFRGRPGGSSTPPFEQLLGYRMNLLICIICCLKRQGQVL